MFILISVSILLATCFLLAFIWATKSGQFDDCETPAIKVLID
ncbi:cbb3-type cytochrome oxidase assembly protein CcoS [Candidatus Uabimicrobium sp. HlEnr_7]